MPDILDLITTSKKNLIIGLAGPGTGKSTSFKTVVESEGFSNKKILVLSFINKLVDDLKFDFRDFGNVEVSTLHAFAMQEYAKKTKKEIELDEALDKLISEDFSYVKGTEIDFENVLHTGAISKEQNDFYEARSEYYGNSNKIHSFNSIIYAINNLYNKKEDFIPNDYDLILVDEFQDFNQLEWDFIKHLNKKNKVVLVGDDDQSLYGWKGAQPHLIRSLYNDDSTDEFSLDYCYRCTEVIVNAVNDLVAGAKKSNLFADRLDSKKYIYPKQRTDNKNEVSAKYKKIDFLQALNGSQLYYQLATRIKKETDGDKSKRVLVIVPPYFKQNMYEGLVKEEINVVGFELFSDEKHRTLKHKYILESYRTLEKRKTDNLSIRKVLHFYKTKEEQKTLISGCFSTNKKLWNCLDDQTKQKIESDIALLKKVRAGKLKLSAQDLKRLNEILNLKNLLSKLLKGFEAHTKDAAEVEITTVMSSKGLSADFVYFVGVDDDCIVDYETKQLTDQSICQFLVGITRAKQKLTLVSFRDKTPIIVGFIDKHVNTIGA